jgi:hypothetical protein
LGDFGFGVGVEVIIERFIAGSMLMFGLLQLVDSAGAGIARKVVWGVVFLSGLHLFIASMK